MLLAPFSGWLGLSSYEVPRQAAKGSGEAQAARDPEVAPCPFLRVNTPRIKTF